LRFFVLWVFEKGVFVSRLSNRECTPTRYAISERRGENHRAFLFYVRSMTVHGQASHLRRAWHPDVSTCQVYLSHMENMPPRVFVLRAFYVVQLFRKMSEKIVVTP
jgi:hypothetical protein